jgi:hypothetical protein
LLRFKLRKQRTPRFVGWLLLIALTLVLSVAEQELNETAAQIGAFGISRSYRRERPRLGVDHGGLRKRRGFDRCGLMKSGAQTTCSGEERKRHSFEHRRTLYCFVMGSARSAPLQATN